MPGRRVRWVGLSATSLASWLVAAALGCHGAPLTSHADGDTTGGGGTHDAASTAASDAAAGAIPDATGGAAGSPPTDVNHGPANVGARRLTNFEYDHTIFDLLGLEGRARATFVSDEHGEIFDEPGPASDAAVEQYFDAADTLAVATLADPAARARLVTCAPTGADDCLRTVILSFAARAWRRPLTAAEGDELLALASRTFTQTGEVDDALHVVVTALLASAPFLYRLEVDAELTSTTPHALSPYELASRLSYWLWSSLPDARLFSLAADGSLLRDDVLRAEVGRMLDDPRGDAFVESFGGQWLGERDFKTHQLEPTVFPWFDDELRASMAGELRLYFGEFARGSRSFATFLDADFNFVDARLARHYGLSTTVPEGALTRVVDLTDQRAGYLGLGAVLTLTSLSYRTAPTLRGHWILGRLLCTPSVGDPSPQTPEPTTSLGRPLEEFDGAGAFRSQYADGTPVDVSGALPDGTTVVGERQLAAALERDPRFVPCAVNRALTFALGRELGASDAPFLARLTEAWTARGLTIRALLEEIALDAGFRTRRGEASP